MHRVPTVPLCLTEHFMLQGFDEVVNTLHFTMEEHEFKTRPSVLTPPTLGSSSESDADLPSVNF